ncbi:hypothetical protein QBC46DRAFT_447712 [Diplogelasinospora grovesii]|uniref:Uncharacterized protein n=1 Tax=Diplogelasinospora grovesii TaxID=303347 RepID=A0AAN6S6R2_9PEZI|nr:hypothetical protein QBC46DRAFT_447712 [Diplogelasinospora grovesii]
MLLLLKVRTDADYGKDLTFVAFINEAGVPEFAIQLTRDATNMSARLIRDTATDGLKKENTPYSTSPNPSHTGTTVFGDAAPSSCSTLPLSIPSEELIDPAMFLEETERDDKLVDCSVSNNTLEETPGVSHERNGMRPS